MLRRFIYGFCMAILVSSCGGGGSGNSSANSANQIELSTTVNVDVNNLPQDGMLHVYVSVDGGAQQDMQITNNDATALISNLPTGSHTIDIEVVFVYDNSATLVLSSATSSVNVAEGSSLLDIANTSYISTYDDDNDGVSNLDEINAGSPPFDSSCVLEVSVVGDCTLG